MNVLLINAHHNYPGWSEGKLNRSFFEAAKALFLENGHPVAETTIEVGYNAHEEERKHVVADIVVLQTPVNWFGAPWIYKKYVDEVFNVALRTKNLLDGDGRTRDDPTRQYGTGGKMQGRKFMISATWNAPSEAFDNADGLLMAGKSTSDLFLNITSNYRFCGYGVLPDFGIFDIYKNPDVERALASYREHLRQHCLPRAA